jgi:hypothetical protein
MQVQTAPLLTEIEVHEMIGKLYWTPGTPTGLVKVTDVEKRSYSGYFMVWIKYIGNHPKGYKSGTYGRYFADELRAQ